MVVGLNQAEIRGLADLEAIVPVELKEGRGNEVRPDLSRHQIGLDRGGKGLVRRQTAVVEKLVNLVHKVSAGHKDEFLDGMVEIRLNIDLGLGRRDTNEGRVLDLLNQVFVGLADESPALLRVEVDIVAPEHHARNVCRIDRQGAVRDENQLLTIKETLKGGEGDVDANRVVLEGQKGNVEARILTKVELEGDVEAEPLGQRSRNEVRNRVAVQSPNHRVEGVPLARGRRQLLPNLHPFARLFVNLLLSHLECDFLDEGIADGIDVTHGRVGGVVQGQARKKNVNVDFAEKVTPSRHQTGDALAEIRRAVEIHGLGFDGEIRVAAIHHFKKGDLGIPRQKDVLLSNGH